jgi:hypothetical protein
MNPATHSGRYKLAVWFDQLRSSSSRLLRLRGLVWPDEKSHFRLCKLAVWFGRLRFISNCKLNITQRQDLLNLL